MISKKTKLDLEISDSESYFGGGEVLTGRAVFSINDKRGIDIQDLSIVVICDIEIYDSQAAVANSKGSVSTKSVSRTLRLWEHDHPINAPNRKIKSGTHAVPFEIPLPSESPKLPPSVTDVVHEGTYGNISYFLKAKVKRSSWFFNANIKAKTPFLFMPSYLVPHHNPLSPLQKQIDFTCFFKSSIAEKPKGLMKLFSSNRRKSAPTPVHCLFGIPVEGIRQDIGSNFRFTLQTMETNEEIMVKSLTLIVQTTLVMRSNVSKSEHVVKSTPVVQQMLLRSGNTVDLSDLLTNVLISPSIIPTFSTPIMSHHHNLIVHCDVTHKSGEALHIAESIPITVLSPRVRVKDADVEATEPHFDHQSDSEQLSSALQTHSLSPHVSDDLDEKRIYHKPVSPTYSGTTIHTEPEDVKTQPPPAYEEHL